MGGPPPAGAYPSSPPAGMAPPGGMPPPPGAPQGAYGPPGGVPSPSTMPAPPGTVQCTSCYRFSKIGMTCEFCQAPLPAPVRAAVPPPAMGGPGYGAPAYNAAPPDAFSIPQAFRDWLRCLTSPKEFFAEQVGADGLASPISFLLVITLLSLIGSVPLMMAQGRAMPAGAAPLPMMLLCVAICLWPAWIVLNFVWAGVVHLICLMFRPQGTYNGTYRAVTYASAPGVVLGVLASLSAALLPSTPAPPTTPGFGSRPVESAPARGMTRKESGLLAFQGVPQPPGIPGGPGGPSASRRADAERMQEALRRLGGPSNPVSNAIQFIAILVYLVYLGIGVAQIHQLSPGAAVAVPIISAIAAVVFLFIIGLILGVLMVGAAMGAAGRLRPR